MMGAKILIIEDDASVGTLEQMMAEAGGYEVRWLRDANRLLEEIGRDFPDIIIMDVMLPEKSGLEAVKELSAHPRFRSIPILYVSVLDLADRYPHALRRDRVGFLQKPFEMEDLMRGIESLID
jgi:DNA-binding response OmpR family regulator